MVHFDEIMLLNPSGKEVAGFIKAMNNEFYIHLSIHDTNTPKKVSIKGCSRLHELLEPVLEDLIQNLCLSNDIEAMLFELQSALERQINVQGISVGINENAKHIEFFEQIQAFGWERVQYMSPDFRTLHLKSIDIDERDHILKVFVSEKFPTEGPTYECDLPKEFIYEWLPGDTLTNIFAAFEEKISDFVEFWRNLEDLDKNTWVLEPEKPRRKDCRRQIAIESGSSLLLIIDPLFPRSVPTCHFLGPDRLIQFKRERFNKSIDLWDPHDSILNNLQNLLNFTFPLRKTAAEEDFCMECGICYSYLLEGSAPDLKCDNRKCKQSFHQSCLYECLKMSPQKKIFGNQLFGECPYCDKSIYCKIP